jgi:phosphomannomutase
MVLSMQASPIPTSHQFHHSILREYDIRGIIQETLFEQDAYFIGRSFGILTKNKGGTSVVIGRDGRESSPLLVKSLAQGLIDSGVNVTDIGIGPTPMLYFANVILKADGAIMVTGSHNPFNHNGFKMVLAGKPFFGPDIQKLGQIAAKGNFPEFPIGNYHEKYLLEQYVERLLSDYSGSKNLTVIWDCGNGATGDVVEKLVASLPGHHKVLFREIDGTFPNHHPDPSDPNNLKDLIKAVIDDKADLGIAFDGDGDRIGIVDDGGHILWGDQILVLLAENLLQHHPGSTIIADVKASETLFSEIRKMGGEPLMWKTGHSLIKTKMAETGCPLAGEMSGHIFFADRYYGFDDALYAAIRFISLVAQWSEKLSQRFSRLPKPLNTPEMRIPCRDDLKFTIIAMIKKQLLEKGERVNDIDGVRVTTDEGWWLLRASNTQAVLVARCEASSEENLSKLTKNLEALLKEHGVSFILSDQH